MKKPKVVLKNVKTFQGHDGQGLNADVWIDGVNCMHVFDGAYGGQFEYTENTYNNPKSKLVESNIKILNEYVKQLPEQDFEFNGQTSKLKINLDMFIDDILVEQEQAKIDKKFEKKKNKLMLTSILLGLPTEKGYSYINYKKPLSNVPKEKLQNGLNIIVLTHCKKGVQVLNTNLNELGVTVNY